MDSSVHDHCNTLHLELDNIPIDQMKAYNMCFLKDSNEWSHIEQLQLAQP